MPDLENIRLYGSFVAFCYLEQMFAALENCLKLAQTATILQRSLCERARTKTGTKSGHCRPNATIPLTASSSTNARMIILDMCWVTHRTIKALIRQGVRGAPGLAGSRILIRYPGTCVRFPPHHTTLTLARAPPEYAFCTGCLVRGGGAHLGSQLSYISVLTTRISMCSSYFNIYFFVLFSWSFINIHIIFLEISAKAQE